MVTSAGTIKRRHTMSVMKVLVCCEDSNARDRGVTLSKKLTHDFVGILDFHFDWSLFESLADPVKAEDLALAAADADVVMFVMHPKGDLPGEVQHWMKGWSKHRSKTGAIVAVFTAEAGSLHAGSSKHAMLSEFARSMQLDYLSELPYLLNRSMPDSPRWGAERAQQSSSVLDSILEQKMMPPPFR